MIQRDLQAELVTWLRALPRQELFTAAMAISMIAIACALAGVLLQLALTTTAIKGAAAGCLTSAWYRRATRTRKRKRRGR